MLFTELALIRWTGANIVHLSYFSNFVLLGSFLGIGVGFLRARARRDLSGLAPIALAGLVAFVWAFPVQIDRAGSELIFFGAYGPTGLPRWITLPTIFIAVACTMAFIGEGVARTFDRFAPLDAYRLDIVGSLAGIVGFSALSFLQAPPIAWGAVAVVVLLITLLPGRRALLQGAQLAASVGIVSLLAAESMAAGTSWSPYYEIKVTGEGDRLVVAVNGVSHQVIQTVSLRRELEPLYFSPYERIVADDPGDVLIIGAGTGGDVAIALSQGASRVDAVEIDPRLAQLGRELNPDRPYDDPRVEVHIDDGRAFLERSRRSFDLILFALPDSLTLVSGQSSVRLESYLFTEEAIRAAGDRLAPGGAFAMYNYYREPWLIDRFATTLQRVFRHPPCLDETGDQGRFAVLTVSADPQAISCETRWEPAGEGVPEPATDDHPFPYLRERTIPRFYVAAVTLILVASVALVRVFGGPLGRMRGYLDLFFMGAAFLLLETRSVIRFALLFGTTWFVNALVFAGVLISVLAAIEVARRRPQRRSGPLYALLFLSLALAWLIPDAALLGLPVGARLLPAISLAFAPIFLANIVFADRFRDVEEPAAAFATNLLGAMLGGVVEYVSLMTGHRMLLLAVAVFYGLAFALRPSSRSSLPKPVPVTHASSQGTTTS